MRAPLLQWRNRDALCWLDVAMLLLVHCKQLRALLADSGLHSNAPSAPGPHGDASLGERSLLKTLIATFDEAQRLFRDVTTSGDATARLETSVGTITVKKGGGDAGVPHHHVTPSNHVTAPHHVTKDDSALSEQDDDFFTQLRSLDLEAPNTTDHDAFSLESLLDDDVTPAFALPGTTANVAPVAASSPVALPDVSSPVTQPSDPLRSDQSSLSAAGHVTSAVNGVSTQPSSGAAPGPDAPPPTAPPRPWAEASSLLERIRERLFSALRPTLRCEKGRNNTPVDALPLLFREHPSVQTLFNLKFTVRCVYACVLFQEHPAVQTLLKFTVRAFRFSENRRVATKFAKIEVEKRFQPHTTQYRKNTTRVSCYRSHHLFSLTSRCSGT